MPVRTLAKPPGEFMRDHLVDAGGMDYPQSIYRAYKLYLRAQGLKDGCTKASMSHYVYLANRLGLIAFDHAGEPSRWDGIENGVDIPIGYVREPRPQAPSPRHYYRIVNPTDDRWIRLEASYREAIGLEVAPAAPRPVPKPPKVKKAPVPKAPKPAPKPKRKVRVPKPPTLTAEEKVQPYEERIGLIMATLSELEVSPSIETVLEIETQLLDLGEEVVEAAKKARGTERTLLSSINARVIPALDEMTLLRSSVDRYMASKTDTERERNMVALRAALRVLKEDLMTPLPKRGG